MADEMPPEQQPQAARRKVGPWLNPQNLGIIIPVLIAMATAWLTQDRAIHALQLQISPVIKEQQEHRIAAAVIRTDLKELQVTQENIKELVFNNITLDAKAHIELQKQMEVVLKQTQWEEDQLKEYKQRIRALEREFDKHKK